MNSRAVLISKIKKGIKCCSIIVKLSAIFCDSLKYIKSENIDDKLGVCKYHLGELELIITLKNKLKGLINIYNPTVEKLEELENLIEDVIGYYEVEITPYVYSIIIGETCGSIDFKDIIEMINCSQSELAHIIGKSKQYVSELKYGKRITVPTLVKLVKEYPLLPWVEFISSINI